MLQLKNVGGLLFDIEGTVSPIRFVYDEMFPYARRGIPDFVRAHWDSPAFRETADAIAQDMGHSSAEAWWSLAEPADRPGLVIDAAIGMMDEDRKATGLKRLQGEVWQSGFESGALKSQLFEDVLPALNRWASQGLDQRIYSSGSVKAQLLFFQYTEHGDLLRLFSGHYDTTTGPKREVESYATIAGAFGIPPAEIVFFSDVVAELDAARGAGLKTILCIRPGNAVVEDVNGHLVVETFADVEFS